MTLLRHFALVIAICLTVVAAVALSPVSAQPPSSQQQLLPTTYVSPTTGTDSPDCGSSASAACRTLVTAIGRTALRGKVLLLPGTYTGTGNIDVHMNGQLLTLESTDGPAVTILDANHSSRVLYVLQGDGDGTTFKGITFANGKSPLGGCVSITGDASPSFENCIFSGCRSAILSPADQQPGLGGAVFVGGHSTPIFRNCEFFSNSADVGGGSAAVIEQSAASFFNCYFHNDSAVLYGGSVVSDSAATPTFDNCTWIGNRSQYGAALDGGGTANSTVSNSRFYNNTAGIGAVIYHYQSCWYNFYNCTFVGNTATGNGGVAAVTAAAGGGYYDSHFAHNRAGGIGGVFYVEISGNLIVSDTHLEHNRALAGGGALAGRLGGSAIINNCLIERNSAAASAGKLARIPLLVPGAFDLADQVTVTARKTTFLSNKCDTNSGAIHLHGNSSFHAIDTNFVTNTAADSGGAIHAVDTAWLTLESCQVVANTAVNSGGAVMFLSTSPALISNTNFSYNSAGQRGGAIALQSAGDTTVPATFLLRGSAVIRNGAMSGGGIFVDSLVPLVIEDSQISHNFARFGGGIWIASPGNRMDARGLINANVAAIRNTYAFAASCQNKAIVAVLGPVVDANNKSQSINNDGNVEDCDDDDDPITGGQIANSSNIATFVGGGGGGVYFAKRKVHLLCPATCIIYGNQASYGRDIASSPSRISANPAAFDVAPVTAVSITVSVLDSFSNVVTDMEDSISVTLTPRPADSSLTVPISLVGRGVAKRLVDQGIADFGPFGIYGKLGGSYILTVSADNLPSIDLPVKIVSCGPGYTPLDDIYTTPYRCTMCVNSYSFVPDSKCLPCPPGASCQGNNVTANPGFWMDPAMADETPQVWRCPPGQCLGNGECAEHRSGILCSECEPGYSDWRGSGICEECSQEAPVWLLIPVFAALVLSGILIHFPALCKSSISATLVFFVQYSSILLPASPQFQAVTDSVNLTFDWINKLSGTSCILRLNNLQKLIFGAFFPLVGIAACLTWGIGLKVWHCGKRRWLDAHDRHGTAVGNVMVDGVPKKVVLAWINAFLFIILWAYMLLTRVIMQMLSCSTIAGQYVVSEAPDQLCRKGAHARWWAAGWIMFFVWVVGLPIFLVGFLKWALQRRARGGSSFWGQALEQIYADFKPRYWFFEFAFLLRKLAIVLLDVYTLFNPVAKAVTALIFAFVNILTLTFIIRPWRRTRDNRMEELLLLILLLEAGLSLGDSTTWSGAGDYDNYANVIRNLQVAGLSIGVGVAIIMAIPAIRKTLRRWRYKYLGPLDEPTIRIARRPPTIGDIENPFDTVEDAAQAARDAANFPPTADGGDKKTDNSVQMSNVLSSATLHPDSGSGSGSAYLDTGSQSQPDIEKGSSSSLGPFDRLKVAASASRRGSAVSAHSILAALHVTSEWIKDKSMRDSLLANIIPDEHSPPDSSSSDHPPMPPPV
ncbi:pectin lyase fold/virulence factor [Geranomyces variabilis]|nr:pectin lyase fold/virulence factor [Geranomyces variabilis]KAJ3139223.1 hypothetical protein HDU90_000587 [Geranomyces variabilis]